MNPTPDKVTIGTKLRTIALFVALLNQLLVTFGYSPIPFDSEAVEQTVASIFTGIVAIWTWWKNNSFTKEARMADKRLKELKGKK